MPDQERGNLLALTSHIVTAHVSNNQVAASDLRELIGGIHAALGGLGRPAMQERRPAVPIRQSVKRDHIVCLEDGKPLRMLRRYLMSRYGLTPDQYRARWGLPADYPMVAPASAERRRAGRARGR